MKSTAKSTIKAINQTNAYIKDLKFTHCKKCGSKHLVKFDVDTFCMDCDWNSVLMDVDCGNFEKRIAIVNRNKSTKQNSELENTEDQFLPVNLIGA